MQLRETKERQVRKLCAEKNIVPKISNFWIELVKLDSLAHRPTHRGEQWDAVQQAKHIDRNVATSYVKSQLISYEEKFGSGLVKAAVPIETRAATAVNLLFNTAMAPMYYAIILKCTSADTASRFLLTLFDKQDDCESILRSLSIKEKKDFHDFKKYFSV